MSGSAHFVLLDKEVMRSQVLWCRSVTAALARWWEDDFESGLGYTARPCLKNKHKRKSLGDKSTLKKGDKIPSLRGMPS